MAARAGQRFPAYGKRLYERRLQGDHPWGIDFIYGEDWVRVDAATSIFDLLAIKPQDYRPGLFDFRVVAGLAVHLIDRSSIECWFADEDDEGFDKFWHLIGELGRWSGRLSVSSSRLFRQRRAGPDQGAEYIIGEETDPDFLAWLCSSYDETAKQHVLPGWWRGVGSR